MSKRVGLRIIGSVGGKVKLADPAWSYDNLIGTIWMPEPQGYDSLSKSPEVREPSGTDPLGEPRGGYYDKR